MQGITDLTVQSWDDDNGDNGWRLKMVPSFEHKRALPKNVCNMHGTVLYFAKGKLVFFWLYARSLILHAIRYLIIIRRSIAHVYFGHMRMKPIRACSTKCNMHKV